MKRESGAVAVDLGASSGRFAAGWIEDGRLRFEIVEQKPHAPAERAGRLVWDLDGLVSLCRRAIDYATAHFESSTLGIDSWGVDHGFIDREGNLLGPPVCYRDPSHEAAMRAIDDCQPELYRLTGIQRQPFNTLCQLIARRQEDPTLPERARWLILPDLIGYLLTGNRGYELTQASTTQLMGLDQTWSREAFRIAGWPLPDREPVRPGGIIGRIDDVDLVRVGSHDTASAVFGMGDLDADQAFLNVGTWSILGCLIDRPLITEEGEQENWSNEIAVDGRARFLKNVPGFYVLNRLHDELGVEAPMGDWLEAAESNVEERFDVFHESLYNPKSMVNACVSLLGTLPSPDRWPGIALMSLVDTLAEQAKGLERVTGRRLLSLRVGGGGSQSPIFCAALERATGLLVERGPAEATVIGNLLMQFASQGVDACSLSNQMVNAR